MPDAISIEQSTDIIKIDRAAITEISSVEKIVHEKTASHAVEIEQRVSMTDIAPPTAEVMISAEAVMIETGGQGIAGVDGRDGLMAAHTHEQTAPSSIWTIRHNLNRKPGVNVLIDGKIAIASAEHLSNQIVMITFTNPQIGTAYLV